MQAAYASLALGSALALFLYPHVMTGVLAAESQKAVKRNAALLPAYFKRDATPRQEAGASRIMSLAVKVGALVFILAAPATQVINFQLAGGVWMLQTLPSVFLALHVRWLNRWAVAAGWAAGIGWGTLMLAQEHFDSPTHALGFLGNAGDLYIAFTALIANVLVAVVGSAVANALGLRTGSRLTEADYLAEPAPSAPPATDALALEPEASEPLARDVAVEEPVERGPRVRQP